MAKDGMSGEGRGRASADLIRAAHDAILRRNWPAWLGGVLLGLTSIAAFAWARPIGVVGGLREWFDWSFYYLGIYGAHPTLSPLASGSSLLTLGLLWGAFCSVLLSRQFVLKVAPPFELIRGAVGGVLMGIGAAMAMGCNVGGFFSAVSALSLGGLAMMAGLIVGAFLETRYLFWEMQTLRFRRGDGKPRKPRKGAPDRRWMQSLAGAAVALAALLAALAYRQRGVDAASGFDYGRAGGLLVAGLAFGFIVHRSRFAFVQAFREPFSTGNAAQARGMAVAVMVSVLGFAALKAGGLRPEGAYVAPTFWVGGFAGGVIFGFGMSLAGGCASGSCWRTAEGNVKQAVALLFMGASNSLARMLIESSSTLSSLMGKGMFLPHYMTYLWSVALVMGVMLAYYAVASWNEKTRAFV